MTGLLSPVALFLPGTTHDYAIWQAGPSILSSVVIKHDLRVRNSGWFSKEPRRFPHSFRYGHLRVHVGLTVELAAPEAEGRRGRLERFVRRPQTATSHGEYAPLSGLYLSHVLIGKSAARALGQAR